MMPTIEVIVENHYAPRCHPSQYAPEESTKPCQPVNQRVIGSELQITPRQVQEGSWSWKGLPGRKAGLSKNFSRLKLANTDICTGTDRRFMDLRAYKTPCNSLYERPEATIYSKVIQQDCLPVPLSCKASWDYCLACLFAFLGSMGVG